MVVYLRVALKGSGNSNLVRFKFKVGNSGNRMEHYWQMKTSVEVESRKFDSSLEE